MAWTCRHYIFISSWREWMHCKMWVFFVIWWKSTRHHPLVITEKKKNGWYVFFTSWKELFLIVGANVFGLISNVLLRYSGRKVINLLIYIHEEVNLMVNVTHKILEHWSPMKNNDSTVISSTSNRSGKWSACSYVNICTRLCTYKQTPHRSSVLRTCNWNQFNTLESYFFQIWFEVSLG